MSLPMSIALYIILKSDYKIYFYSSTLVEHIEKYYTDYLLQIGGWKGYVDHMQQELDKM